MSVAIKWSKLHSLNTITGLQLVGIGPVKTIQYGSWIRRLQGGKGGLEHGAEPSMCVQVESFPLFLVRVPWIGYCTLGSEPHHSSQTVHLTTTSYAYCADCTMLSSWLSMRVNVYDCFVFDCGSDIYIYISSSVNLDVVVLFRISLLLHCFDSACREQRDDHFSAFSCSTLVATFRLAGVVEWLAAKDSLLSLSVNMVKPVCFQIQTPTPTPYPLIFCFVFALTQAVDIVGGPARYWLLCSFRHMVESESSTHCLPVIMLVTQMLCRNDRETDTAATVQFQPLLLQQLCFHLTSSFILVQPLLLCFHHLSSLCYFVFIIYTGPAFVTLFSSFILVQPLFSSFILVQPLLLCFHHLYWSSHCYFVFIIYTGPAFVFIIYTGPAFVFIIYTGPAFVTLFSSFILVQPLFSSFILVQPLFSSFILVQPLFSSFILVQPLLLCFHHLYWSSLCFHHLYWSSLCFHHLYWSSLCFHHLYWSSLCYFVFIIYTGPAFVTLGFYLFSFDIIIYIGRWFLFVVAYVFAGGGCFYSLQEACHVRESAWFWFQIWRWVFHIICIFACAHLVQLNSGACI